MPLVYDYILTIADEVDLIWCRRLSVASAIFITNRIAVLLIVMYTIMSDVASVCDRLHMVHRCLTIL